MIKIKVRRNTKIQTEESKPETDRERKDRVFGDDVWSSWIRLSKGITEIDTE